MVGTFAGLDAQVALVTATLTGMLRAEQRWGTLPASGVDARPASCVDARPVSGVDAGAGTAG